MYHQVFVESLWSNHIDVSVKDSCSDKKCLFLVFFLLVQVKDFLDSIRSIMLVDTILLLQRVWDFLGKRGLLVLSCLKVVLHHKSLLHRSDPKITGLSELWMMLVIWAHLLPIVKYWVLVDNILLVNLGQIGISLMPSVMHQLSEVLLILFLDPCVRTIRAWHLTWLEVGRLTRKIAVFSRSLDHLFSTVVVRLESWSQFQWTDAAWAASWDSNLVEWVEDRVDLESLNPSCLVLFVQFDLHFSFLVVKGYKNNLILIIIIFETFKP